MENNIYKTFIFYNNKGQRLGIFSRVLQDEIQVVVIPCSRKDQFSRKESKELYKKYIQEATSISKEDLAKKNIELISLTLTEENPGKIFFTWCRATYLKKFSTTISVTYNYLSKDRKIITTMNKPSNIKAVVSKKLKIYE